LYSVKKRVFNILVEIDESLSPWAQEPSIQPNCPSTFHMIEVVVFIKMPDDTGFLPHHISFFIERLLNVC